MHNVSHMHISVCNEMPWMEPSNSAHESEDHFNSYLIYIIRTYVTRKPWQPSQVLWQAGNKARGMCFTSLH